MTSVGGAWQIARIDEQEIKDRTEPVKELSVKADELHWKGIKVPGNRDDERPDLQYAHRFAYRTRLNVPAECKGRACYLHFPCNAVISSAIVNGVYCGGSKAPCTAWDCDVTKAVKPGEVNEVWVAIKDPYYAIANTGDPKNPSAATCSTCRPAGSTDPAASAPRATPICRSSSRFRAPACSRRRRSSSPARPTRPTCSAIPSVKNKELGLEISVTNPTGSRSR